MASQNGTPNPILDKQYYKIREVGRIVGVEPHVLRFWETEFKQVNPRRTPSGQRLYQPQDIAVILRIKHLLYDRKFTIEGARQHLEGEAAPPSSPAWTETLARIRQELEAIRDLLA